MTRALEFIRWVVSRRACGNCGKAEAFCAPAFPSSGGNHQEEVAAGHLFRFPRLWQFPQASAFFLFCFFFLSFASIPKFWKNFRFRIAYRPLPRVGSTKRSAAFRGDFLRVARRVPSNSIGERYSNAEWSRCLL